MACCPIPDRLGNEFTNAAVLSSWSIAVFGSEDACSIDQVLNFTKVLEGMLVEKGVKVYFPSDRSRMVVYQVCVGLSVDDVSRVEMGLSTGHSPRQRRWPGKLDKWQCKLVADEFLAPTAARWIWSCAS